MGSVQTTGWIHFSSKGLPIIQMQKRFHFTIKIKFKFRLLSFEDHGCCGPVRPLATGSLSTYQDLLFATQYISIAAPL